MKVSLKSAKTGERGRVLGVSKSDGIRVAEGGETEISLNAKKSDLRNGLTRRQRIFILEKMAGLTDKEPLLLRAIR